MPEQERGCGFRKIGGIYLVCDAGPALICDGLPLPLEACGCCGFIPPFNRNLQKIQPGYIAQAEEKLHLKNWMSSPIGFKQLKDPNFKGGEALPGCECPEMCPICNIKGQEIQGIQFGLMFVGSEYTPSSFIKEATQMGISKRIPEIPPWLKLGETWIFLAHCKTPKVSLEELKANSFQLKEPEVGPAIFYGFKPQRVEMPVWKGQLTDERILELEKQGITPIIIDPTEENKKRHKPANIKNETLERRLWDQ